MYSQLVQTEQIPSPAAPQEVAPPYPAGAAGPPACISSEANRPSWPPDAFNAQLLAQASHDLCQPLHAMALLNGMLGRPQPPERVADISRQLDRSLACMQRMMNSVLDLARLESGTVAPRLDAVQLDELARTVADDFLPSAREVGLDLRVAVAPCLVCTDAALLERMLRNLVHNALKFTSEGGVLINLQRAPGGSATLWVIDTGLGIPLQLRGHMFEAYVRGAGTQEGLGLGLAIVRRFADLLGFNVTVQDNAPRGTRFGIAFPADAVISVLRASGQGIANGCGSMPPA